MMVCPTCGERVWKYDERVFTCQHGHLSVKATDDSANPALQPAPPKAEWSGPPMAPEPDTPSPALLAVACLPYVGGLCGIAALIIELV